MACPAILNIRGLRLCLIFHVKQNYNLVKMLCKELLLNCEMPRLRRGISRTLQE